MNFKHINFKHINYILVIFLTLYTVNSRPYSIITDKCLTFTAGENDNCISIFTLCSNYFETIYIKFINDVCYNKTDYLIGSPIPGNIYTCCNKNTFYNNEF